MSAVREVMILATGRYLVKQGNPATEQNQSINENSKPYGTLDFCVS